MELLDLKSALNLNSFERPAEGDSTGCEEISGSVEGYWKIILSPTLSQHFSYSLRSQTLAFRLTERNVMFKL